MEENNYLLDESHIDGSYQLRLKIKYLQEDKQKLQISNKEMGQNIKLLREINKELSKTNQTAQQSVIIKKLQEQNTKLQQSYSRILQQNKALSCRNLMLQQIIQETQTEQRQILKGYESKIIQLRRSIQFKESCIQSYQQNVNCISNGFDAGNIPPSNISMIFFNQIDQFKNTIAQLQQKNKLFQAQVIALKAKNTLLEEEKVFVDNLMMSRDGLNQLKLKMDEQRMNKKQRVNSQGKESRQKFKLNQKNKNQQSINKQASFKRQNRQCSLKKEMCVSSQAQETRQMTYQSTSSNYKLNQLKDELKKSKLQFSKLSLAYRKENTKRKQNDQKIKILFNSNNYYKQKRQTNAQQLNYYKRAALDLLTLLQRRKIKRQHSLDKTEVQKIIQNVQKPKEIQPIRNTKNFWTKLQQQINSKLSSKSKLDLETINRTRLRKSFSNIIDFTQLCHDDDKIDKYYQHNYNTNTHKTNSKSKLQHNSNNINNLNNPNNLDDFSRILELGVNGDVFDDQTFIIKPKVMSYAERKKTKTKSRISDPHNLTIIRQNVL